MPGASDRNQRVVRSRKIQALVDRGGTEGEWEAAAAALVRVGGGALSDAAIRRLPVPASGQKIHWDDVTPGLGVRITKGGSRAFLLDYRVRGSGRQRRFTIGSTEDWSLGAARREAKRLRAEIDLGRDPLAEIEAERNAPTMDELIERFEREHLPGKRASTQGDYQGMINRHIRPHFRSMRVADVAFGDVDRLHRRITADGHGHQANRCVAVLSRMFSLAVRWGWLAANPCKGIEKNTEHGRQRYLTAAELPRLQQALDAYSDQSVANVFRVLTLTGARKGEVLGLKWADVDIDAGIWLKPPSSTKQAKHHRVPLSAAVIEILNSIPRQSEFVFPSSGAAGHLTEVKKAWASILKAAGIRDLRIHDLRHSFASALVSDGASLALIGSLLGHSSPLTTSRYAHLLDTTQRQAVERIGARIKGRAE